MVKDLCFEIIEACPNNCKFCSSNSEINKSKIISYKDFKRVIDYFMSNGGIEELSLSGGEPFLHPNLIEMVKYAKAKGIRTIIFSSGIVMKNKIKSNYEEYLLKEMNDRVNAIIKNEPWNVRLIEQIKKYYMKLLKPKEYDSISKNMFRYLKSIGLDKIVFDYQAYEVDTDKYLMGRNNNLSISLLDSMLNASSSDLNVGVHFIPMKYNYKEILDILEILEIAKIKNISILNFVPQGRGRINKKELQLSNDELQEFFELMNEASKHYSGNIRIGIPLRSESCHECNAGLEKLDIKFDGTILPCPAFKELTVEDCKKYNIKLYNIYESLEQVNILEKGTRNIKLFKRIYQNKT